MTALRNPGLLGLIQAGEDRAEEEGYDEAGEEEGGGKPEDDFAEARGDFAGFGILRIAGTRAEARACIVGVNEARGNHGAGDGKGPGFVAREGDEPRQSRERGRNRGSESHEDEQGRKRAAE